MSEIDLNNNIYTHNIDVCKICWKICDTKSPCNCNNLVHLDCLKNWIKSRTQHMYYCDVCNQFYRNISIFSFINTIILIGFNALIFYISDLIWGSLNNNNNVILIINVIIYTIICSILIIIGNYYLLKFFKRHSKYVRYYRLKIKD